MGLFSFFGRLLFASFFILSAWQMYSEFGVDGGPTAKELRPKLNLVRKHLSAKVGVVIPHFDIRKVVATIIVLKGPRGRLVSLRLPPWSLSAGRLLQLALTTPILCDFYNYDPSKSEFEALLNDFTRSMAFFGALLFFIGMKNSMPPRRQHKKKMRKAKAS